MTQNAILELETAMRLPCTSRAVMGKTGSHLSRSCFRMFLFSSGGPDVLNEAYLGRSSDSRAHHDLRAGTGAPLPPTMATPTGCPTRSATVTITGPARSPAPSPITTGPRAIPATRVRRPIARKADVIPASDPRLRLLRRQFDRRRARRFELFPVTGTGFAAIGSAWSVW